MVLAKKEVRIPQKIEYEFENVYAGFATDKGLVIDLDTIPFEKIQKIAEHHLKNDSLEGYIIMESSPQHYHIVFNAYLPWKTIAMILYSFRHPSIRQWADHQMRRGYLTLRVTPKNGYTPQLRVLKGKCNKLINKYINTLNLFKDGKLW